MKCNLCGEEYEFSLGHRCFVMQEKRQYVICPRCQTGIDNDGDGNCATCAKLSDAQAAKLKGEKA